MLLGKQKVSLEEKEALREKKLRIKDKWEQSQMGAMYEELYPIKTDTECTKEQMAKYQLLLARSKEVWEESISGGGYSKKKGADPPAADVQSQKSITAGATTSNKPNSSQGMRKTQQSFQ